MRTPSLYSSASSLLALAAAAIFAPASSAHDVRLPIAADELKISFSGPVGNQGVEFIFTGQEPVLLNHDPRVNDTAVLVYGTGAFADSTGRLDLDPALWTSTPGGYAYSDPSGTALISSVILEHQTLSVVANSANWPWIPGGPVDQLWFHFLLENEWWCAEGDSLTAPGVNQASRIIFTSTQAPSACPVQVCGNGIREPGELCDDGNRIEGDGCSNDCQSDSCTNVEFDSTYEGIQSIVFDGVYECTNQLCHSALGAPSSGNLQLTADVSYSQLVDVLSTSPTSDGVTRIDRVEPGEPVASFLVHKLQAGIDGEPAGMPVGGMIAPEHLEAIEKWIRAGAPENLVVAETAGLLGTCLPPDDPLKIDPPPPLPAQGEGIQFRSTAWPLPASFEDEICFATYYDFTATNLVPPEDQLDCPGFGATNNPSGKCFYYNRTILRQDAQSHHSIIHIYNGDTAISEPGAFGPFTYKPNFPNAPGAASGLCDPMNVDPATGWNPDCSGVIVSGAACTGYVPVDAATNAPAFGGSQEPFTDQEYANGVYSVLPMTGVILWNSHAFNLTDTDSTLAQYLDIHFGDSGNRQYPARGIFDIDKIFIQQVPPFETREYCKTYTLPPQSNVFELSSHTHRWGTRFRIWAPPNQPCNPGGFNVFACEGSCNCGPGDPSQLIYFSTVYTDPVYLELDPPMFVDGPVEDRTFLYCSLYDNGSVEGVSPAVKRQSTSPEPPPGGFQGLDIDIGGPCPDVDTPYIGGIGGLTYPGVMCMDGPNKGVKCGAEPNPAAFCETSPGALDGECDACTTMGGFTTEDEMFILLGSYFIPEPSALALTITATLTVVLLARRRRYSR